MISSAADHASCIGVSGNGMEYLELACLYPFLKPFYSSREMFYDPIPTVIYMQERPYIPLAAVSIYAISIIAGTKYMKNREAWSWRSTLTLWNLLLSVFSWIGTFRTFPQLVHNLSTMQLRDVFCETPVITFGSGSTGVWVQLFILSKMPELLDTFFIIIHKKPLIFLHWYHHVTVLLYCWHSYVTMSPYGLFFICMNYAVHASMYGYYFLMAAKMKPKWLKPIFITVLQISQMIVGVIVTICAYYYRSTDSVGDCNIQAENNAAAFIMYGSYLFLFVQFFFLRYFKGTSVKVKRKRN